MYGRYGGDAFGKFLLWVYIALLLINLFAGSIILLPLLELAVAVLMIFRMFSRNVYKRSAENRKYLEIMGKFKQSFNLTKSKWRDRKTHVYKKCPHCKAVIRLPKKKGDHKVDCPKCRREFSVKI